MVVSYRTGDRRRLSAMLKLFALLLCTLWCSMNTTSSFIFFTNNSRISTLINRGIDDTKIHYEIRHNIASNKKSQLYSSSGRNSENDDAHAPSSDVSSSNSDNTERNNKKRRKPSRITDDKNLYEILGASPSMSRSEIKRLYINLAKQTHPDSYNSSNNNSIDATEQLNEDRFNEVAQAWDILSDNKTRRAYDRELAANDFKEDIIKKASELANEYGPSAQRFYDDVAIPLLRRTTATTLAGWSAVTEERDERQLETPEQEDLGQAFKRVVEAGMNATRKIDGLELQEKSMELRKRADETRDESMNLLEQLTQIKCERLRLTFHTSAEFTAEEASQYIDGLIDQGVVTSDDDEQVTLLQRMTFKHPIQQNIEAFSMAEIEFDERLQEKYSIDEEMLERQVALEECENNVSRAMEAEVRARRMLEEAQQQVADSQSQMLKAQNSIREFDVTVKKADLELTKANTTLQRKRNVVRRELKRRAEKFDGSVFDQSENGNVRLNPAFDKSMNGMGFGEQSLATIDALRKDEQRIEGQFLGLVEKASRLVSRSERLRVRSEELIGKQQQISNNAEVVGDNFRDEIADAARIKSDIQP